VCVCKRRRRRSGRPVTRLWSYFNRCEAAEDEKPNTLNKRENKNYFSSLFFLVNCFSGPNRCRRTVYVSPQTKLWIKRDRKINVDNNGKRNNRFGRLDENKYIIFCIICLSTHNLLTALTRLSMYIFNWYDLTTYYNKHKHIKRSWKKCAVCKYIRFVLHDCISVYTCSAKVNTFSSYEL